MIRVTLSIEAILQVVVDTDDKEEAIRMAKDELRHNRNLEGRPMSLVSVDALTTERVEE